MESPQETLAIPGEAAQAVLSESTAGAVVDPPAPMLTDVAPWRRGSPFEDRQVPILAPLRDGERSFRMVRKAPWTRRGRSGVTVAEFGDVAMPRALDGVRLKALGLRSGPRRVVSRTRWPQEPNAPALVQHERFRAAIEQLCPTDTPAGLLDAIAEGALEAAEAFSVEPFLLVALAYQQSRCGAVPEDSWGIGVTRINPGMHRAHIRNGVYRYGVWQPNEGFVSHRLAMHRYPFDRKHLARVKPNLYFAAAFMRTFSEQCPDIDDAFNSAPHRSPISHVVWGDHVRSPLAEDIIFTARRRLLGYYQPSTMPHRAYYRGVSFTSPLDGDPRLVIGVMGDPRESGKRRHMGIDFLSVQGEPVRAMAPGTVTFAGVDSRARGFLSLTPEQAQNAHHDRMGPRGLFVQVVHGRDVSTLYVHLDSYVVSTGDMVKRGQLLGYVGRTGIHSSDAHLHLGLFDGTTPVDPLPQLQSLLIAPDDLLMPQVPDNSVDPHRQRPRRPRRGARRAALGSARGSSQQATR